MLLLNCQFLTSLNRTESDQPFILFEKGKLSPDGRKFHGGGRVVSASGSETSVSSSMPASAIIYDAYTSIINKIKKKKKKIKLN